MLAARLTVRVNVGDHVQLGILRIEVLAEHMMLQLAEMPAEGDVRLARQALMTEQKHAMAVERRGHGRHLAGIERAAEVEIENLSREVSSSQWLNVQCGDCLHGIGHGDLPLWRRCCTSDKVPRKRRLRW